MVEKQVGLFVTLLLTVSSALISIILIQLLLLKTEARCRIQ